jgi:hypothetical protein
MIKFAVMEIASQADKDVVTGHLMIRVHKVAVTVPCIIARHKHVVKEQLFIPLGLAVVMKMEYRVAIRKSVIIPVI